MSEPACKVYAARLQRSLSGRRSSRNLAAQLAVAHSVDLAHAAGTGGSEDFIQAKTGVRCQVTNPAICSLSLNTFSVLGNRARVRGQDRADSRNSRFVARRTCKSITRRSARASCANSAEIPILCHASNVTLGGNRQTLATRKSAGALLPSTHRRAFSSCTARAQRI